MKKDSLLNIIPECVIRYICDFLCLCETCFKRNYKHDCLSCSHCNRYWCSYCRPLDNVLKCVYIPYKHEKVYICAWCLREQRNILNSNNN